MKRIAVGLLAATICSCSNDIEAQFGRVERFAESAQNGTSRDVFLVRSGIAGNERVGFIYAMADDMAVCLEIAADMSAKYPRAPYSCEYAN
ncbi:hypothetical protein [Pseudoxanthomonas dokdonensis]|uniref:Lipoprotein n=1 Tax=Pseudoxanthomonas dokdonensis TaxID=344882 RepID=A0A0R0CHU3_9GAMM|nr:hypothetical protein [Pseudoxanthomonas dokdonensis]KRG69141.1 hypothetical protein ABB29_12110 [Pseudoxanthomonas dokdonensis]